MEKKEKRVIVSDACRKEKEENSGRTTPSGFAITIQFRPFTVRRRQLV